MDSAEKNECVENKDLYEQFVKNLLKDPIRDVDATRMLLSNYWNGASSICCTNELGIFPIGSCGNGLVAESSDVDVVARCLSKLSGELLLDSYPIIGAYAEYIGENKKFLRGPISDSDMWVFAPCIEEHLGLSVPGYIHAIRQRVFRNIMLDQDPKTLWNQIREIVYNRLVPDLTNTKTKYISRIHSRKEILTEQGLDLTVIDSYRSNLVLPTFEDMCMAYGIRYDGKKKYTSIADRLRALFTN
jgi:hypothetical protein